MCSVWKKLYGDDRFCICMIFSSRSTRILGTHEEPHTCLGTSSQPSALFEEQCGPRLTMWGWTTKMGKDGISSGFTTLLLRVHTLFRSIGVFAEYIE